MAETKHYARRERMMLAVQAALPPAVSIPSVSECKARCVGLQGAPKEDCENECEAWEVTALVAERLRRALLMSFQDVIWGGGNIDPRPDPHELEVRVRARFAQAHMPPNPDR